MPARLGFNSHPITPNGTHCQSFLQTPSQSPPPTGSSQHGSARIGNARESSGADRIVAGPQGVATYRGDQTGSARTAIRCGKSEIGLSSAMSNVAFPHAKTTGFRSGASDFGKNHTETSSSENPS
jgi:hypothetical protein